MWGFATDMRIQGDCAIVLQQVLDAVEAHADDAYRARVAERIASSSGAREVLARKRAVASANNGGLGALNPAFVFATLSAKLSPDDVVLNEAIRWVRSFRTTSNVPDPKAMSALPAADLDFPAVWRWGLNPHNPGAASCR